MRSLLSILIVAILFAGLPMASARAEVVQSSPTINLASPLDLSYLDEPTNPEGKTIADLCGELWEGWWNLQRSLTDSTCSIFHTRCAYARFNMRRLQAKLKAAFEQYNCQTRTGLTIPTNL